MKTAITDNVSQLKKMDTNVETVLNKEVLIVGLIVDDLFKRNTITSITRLKILTNDASIR
jgi:hypothetical protein